MTTLALRVSRKTLLATVSAVALTLAWGPEARAADIFYPAVETTGQAPPANAETYVWLSLEGRYNIFDSNIFDTDAHSGYGDPDAGWSGVLELGVRPSGGPWDYVGRFIYGHAEGSDDGVFPSADGEEDSIIADFEVGRHIGVGLLGGDTRIHAGLRFAHFDATTDFLAYLGPALGYVSVDNSQTITAVGPRIGIDQTIPLASNVSIDLSAAGAALFGTRETDFFAYPSPDEHLTIWNAEASAGLTYDLGAASMTLGYRIDAFWDLYWGADGAPDNDRITHGPFARLTVGLAGGN